MKQVTKIPADTLSCWSAVIDDIDRSGFSLLAGSARAGLVHDSDLSSKFPWRIRAAFMKSADRVKYDLVELLPRLYRYARNLTRSSTDADDLLQATCIRVFDKWSQFKLGTDFDRWAFPVMSSISCNHLRADRTCHGSDQVDAAEELQSKDSPDGNKLRDEVSTLLSNLPDASSIINQRTLSLTSVDNLIGGTKTKSHWQVNQESVVTCTSAYCFEWFV